MREPYWQSRDGRAVLWHGDSIDVLRTLPAESVDSCVCDAPYGMSEIEAKHVVAALTAWLAGEEYQHKKRGFMGRTWDSFVPGPELWREVLRVLKPGGHLLNFASTRTAHLMNVAIHLAGFEVRDSFDWIYGSGFPKSHNLDGAHEGWGTALKPAHEPIVVARKPLVGTVAANVAQHGTGAINIDAARVASDTPIAAHHGTGGSAGHTSGAWNENYAPGDAGKFTQTAGRWPPNVLLTHGACADGDCAEDCPVALLDRQSGDLKNGGQNATSSRGSVSVAHGGYKTGDPTQYAGDSGGASRFFPTFEHDPFFYTAKAPAAEREIGLGHRKRRKVNDGRATEIDNAYQRGENKRANTHPTVKPIDVMRWLCRLVTPRGGLVLDPFLGSGTTAIAATREQFRVIGIEREAEYIEIARDRIMGDAPLLNAGGL